MEIGSRLNVSENDVRNLRKERIKGKFLYLIAGLIVSGFSAIAGFLMGKANHVCVNCEGYPFAAGLAVTGTLKKRKFFLATTAATLLLSVIGFMVAYRIGQNMFGVAIEYSVYRRG